MAGKAKPSRLPSKRTRREMLAALSSITNSGASGSLVWRERGKGRRNCRGEAKRLEGG